MGDGMGELLCVVSYHVRVLRLRKLFIEGNLVYGGAATQSRVLWSYGPQLAIDGDTQTCSFTTSRDGQRWWQVKEI